MFSCLDFIIAIVIGIIAHWLGNYTSEIFGFEHPRVIGFIIFILLILLYSSVFGKREGPRKTIHAHRYQEFNFLENLLILSADVIKADGHFKRSELDYLRNFFTQNLGQLQAQLALNRLREILQENHNRVYVCETIRSNTHIHERLLVLQFLFGLANADGHLHPEEILIIEKISILLDISRTNYESVKAMFMGGGNPGGDGNGYRSHTLDNDYKILGISADASDDEVKKAYRTMAKQYHPDRVAHLGEEMRKQAEEKFSRMTDAYDRIKKARGM